MFPPETWLFDLEIKNIIPERDKPRRFGMNYCKHWGDHAGMGIACLVAARPDLSQVFTFVTGEDIIPQNCEVYHLSIFAELLRSAELLIGHNSRLFDCKVLATRGIYIPSYRHLDFYHEIKKATRLVAPKGYSLAALTARCGGPEKSGDGYDMPYLWQVGHRREVIDYCQNDIKMLAAVADFYRKNDAHLPCPEIGTYLTLRTPSLIQAEDYGCNPLVPRN